MTSYSAADLDPHSDPRLRASTATKLAIDAARDAGECLMTRFRAGSDALETRTKETPKTGRRNLITEADQESERRIVDRIREAFPDDRILAEEGGTVGSSRDDAPLWIVDPLDGTTNYAHGHPLFSISIARLVDGQPELGIVFAPAIGEFHWAERGLGAWRGTDRLSVNDPVDFAEALLATGFSYARAEFDGEGLNFFRDMLDQAREIRRGGSAALDLAHTAAGIFSGFWERGLQPHDVAAGTLLVREAGGVVTDFGGGDDWLHSETLIAGGPNTHDRLAGRLREFWNPAAFDDRTNG